MNGIFSATPAPGPIRLVLGSQGLLLVQSLIAWHLPAIPALFRALIALTGFLALAAFCIAVIGEDRHARSPWRRRSHDR